MDKPQKTHFADDETLARLIRLERVYEAAKNYFRHIPDTNFDDWAALNDALNSMEESNG